MTTEQLLELIKGKEFKSQDEILKEIKEEENNRTSEEKFNGQMIIEEIKHQDLISNAQFKKEYGYNKLDY